MGLIGKVFRRHRREDKFDTPPVGTPTPKAPRRKAGQPHTRSQIVGRRRAMAGRRANVQRLVKARKP